MNFALLLKRSRSRKTCILTACGISFIAIVGWMPALCLLLVFCIASEWRYWKLLRIPAPENMEIGDEPAVPPIDPKKTRMAAVHEMGHIFSGAANGLTDEILSVSIGSVSGEGCVMTTPDLCTTVNNVPWGYRLIGFKFGGLAAERQSPEFSSDFGSLEDEQDARNILGRLVAISNPMFTGSDILSPNQFPGLDREINLLFQTQVERNLRIFNANRALFDEAVERLMEAKNIEGEELQLLMSRVRDPDAPTVLE